MSVNNTNNVINTSSDYEEKNAKENKGQSEMSLEGLGNMEYPW